MEIEKIIEKKTWLDYLYYKENNQRDFFVCGTYGDRKFTKWKTYLNSVANIDILNLEKNTWKNLKYFEQINQRQILPREIVLDIEEPKQLEPIVKQLKIWGWEYSVFITGSRGYHIRILFNEDFTPEEKESIVFKFGTDIQKCSEKNLIALENCPHWKTGKLKHGIEL